MIRVRTTPTWERFVPPEPFCHSTPRHRPARNRLRKTSPAGATVLATSLPSERLFFSLVGLLAGVLLGCTTQDTDSSSPVCRAGESVYCQCRDGSSGTQACRDDGSGYEPCDCSIRNRDSGSPADVEGDETTSEDAEIDAVDQAFDETVEDTAVDVVEDAQGDDVVDISPDRSDVLPPDVSVDPPNEPEADAPVIMRELGEDCSSASECESGICLSFEVGGDPVAVCTEPCCHEETCPYAFGCLQLAAGRYCLPSRIFPPGYTFTQPTGTSCGVDGNACKSGICDSSADLCRGTCCTDSDCDLAICHWVFTNPSHRTYCDPVATALTYDLRTGQPCSNPMDCRSGVCINVSGAGQCADLCCSPSTCPGATTCGLVEGDGPSYVRACVPLPTGDIGEGLPCDDDGESCGTGNCFEGVCRRLCCLDSDCPSGRCLPRLSSEGVLAPVCIYD